MRVIATLGTSERHLEFHRKDIPAAVQSSPDYEKLRIFQ
jgi:hypothetical protein